MLWFHSRNNKLTSKKSPWSEGVYVSIHLSHRWCLGAEGVYVSIHLPHRWCCRFGQKNSISVSFMLWFHSRNNKLTSKKSPWSEGVYVSIHLSHRWCLGAEDVYVSIHLPHRWCCRFGQKNSISVSFMLWFHSRNNKLTSKKSPWSEGVYVSIHLSHRWC